MTGDGTGRVSIPNSIKIRFLLISISIADFPQQAIFQMVVVVRRPRGWS